MVKWQTVRHQVALWGRVTDTGTNKAVSGALVSIEPDGMPAGFARLLEARAMQFGDAWERMPERLDQKRTAEDGIFYFVDLPEGDYTLKASIPSMGKRYLADEKRATVSRDANGNYRRAFLGFALQATRIRGKVIGSDTEAGVSMAEIRLKGSGECAFSNSEGEYVLAGIEPARGKDDATGKPRKRTLLVFARGYQFASEEVAIHKAGDDTQVREIRLVRESSQANAGRSGKGSRQPRQ